MVTEKGHFHLCAIGIFVSVGHVYEKYGQKGAIFFQHVFIEHFDVLETIQALGKERWNKTKFCLCGPYILMEQTNVYISIST